MTVRVSYAAYIGATTAVAKKDVRYYLNGLFFDPNGYLVAADGHRLFCSSIEPGHGPHIAKINGKAPRSSTMPSSCSMTGVWCSATA